MDKRTLSAWIMFALGAVFALISAFSTFQFFVVYFPNFVAEGLLGDQVRMVVTGTCGVLLLDAGAIGWAVAFLYVARTKEQRTIAALASMVTFVGSLAASITYFALSGVGYMALDNVTRSTFGLLGIALIVVALAVDFGGTLAFMTQSPESKVAIREGRRDAALLDAQNDAEKYMDKRLSVNVKREMRDAAPAVAEEFAKEIVSQFIDAEGARYKTDPKANGAGVGEL